jgi:phage terminase Nu1 subunit (DNA packaging protein)
MKLVNATELGALLGVHRGTIQGWIQAGLPIQKKAKPGEKGGHQFVMKDVVAWLESRAVHNAVGNTDLMTADEAKRRKLSAEAGLQEIILAKRKGQIIELDDVEKKLSNSFAMLRSSMLKIPDRTSMQLVGETDEEVIKQVLKQEISEALDVLANWNSFEEEEEPEDE